MATKNLFYLSVGPTPVQIVAANINRKSLVLRVGGGRVYLGVDNTVSVATGFPWGPEDGVLQDSVASTDAWWGVAPGAVDVRGMEVSS